MSLQPGCEALETKYIANALHICPSPATSSHLTPPPCPPNDTGTQTTFRCVNVVCLLLMHPLRSHERPKTIACNKRLATKRNRTFYYGMSMRRVTSLILRTSIFEGSRRTQGQRRTTNRPMINHATYQTGCINCPPCSFFLPQGSAPRSF